MNRLPKALVTLALLLIPLKLTPAKSLCHNYSNGKSTPDFLKTESAWVSTTLKELSLNEMIGQLFMVAAYSNKGDKHIDDVALLVKKYHIGGLIFFQGGPIRQANYTNKLQEEANIPLLIAIDAEWGLSMRLDSTIKFPRQLALGSIRDNKLVYEMGKEIGRQCKRLGVHINLAPVVDININPLNPVINDRSFGENKLNVAQKSLAYMKGLQDEGVLACAKHFPGHGDTDSDSHKTLPTISHNKARLDSIELYPFKAVIKGGIGAIMSAHLHIPAYEIEKNIASSISRNIINGLLKKELGFEGIIITDALNMKGATKYFSPGQLEVKAIQAGNDILLFPMNVPKAVNAIKKAIKKGELSKKDIEISVKKILQLKYWAGLHQYKPIETETLYKDLNTPKAEVLKRKLIMSSLTLVRNKDDAIPFKKLNKYKFASLAIGAIGTTTFQSYLSKYAKVFHSTTSKKSKQEVLDKLINKLKDYNHVFISLHDLSRHSSKDYGINMATLNLLKVLNKATNITLVIFGSPYSLKYFNEFHRILMAYEETELTQSMAAQLLFGGIKAKGILPIGASKDFQYGHGLKTSNPIRLRFGIPEEVGIEHASLYPIDSIVNEAITGRMTPGCQILIVKDTVIIYERSFGYHTYQKAIPVTNDDLYDLASITKIAASMPALMRLYEDSILDLNQTLGHYLPISDSIDKHGLVIKDVLLHQSGLRGWIPFYIYALRDTNIAFFNCDPSEFYCIKVADDLYLKEDFLDSIWNKIYFSELQPPGNYVYSDVGFYFFKAIIEKYTDQAMESYLEENFYNPLGLTTMTYRPKTKFPMIKIVPTQLDTFFRDQLIHGDVHDPGAALMEGVGGHAGLFSNAHDLAIYMQMLLNYGKYGGDTYFDSSTVAFFTSKQVEHLRKGLGFDKPETDSAKLSPSSWKASPKAFGHTGFTGTCAWSDPMYNLTYVFLSNRIHPDMNNRKLIQKNIRTRIQDVIYDAIIDFEAVDTASIDTISTIH